MCFKKLFGIFGKKETNQILLENKIQQPEEQHPDESSAISLRLTKTEEHYNEVLDKKFIICNGKKVAIEWDKVVLWTDGLKFGQPASLSLPEKNFERTNNRNPQMFVCHYDVCQTTRMMVDVLKDRGLSVHFGLDSDGTIYQLTDCENICWHAKGVNNISIGVEICNPVLTKYGESQTKINKKERTIVKNDIIHNRETGPYLYYYPEQIKALVALIKAVCGFYNIPLIFPLDKNGEVSNELSQKVVNNTFKGIVGHFHLNPEKIDPGSILLKEIKGLLK